MFQLPPQHRFGLGEASRLAAPEVAVAGHAGDGLTGAQKPRSQQGASVYAVADFDFQPGAAAQIPAGGDAGPHHGFGPFGHGRQALGSGQLVRGLGVVRVKFQMHVRVDQAGNGGEARAVDDAVAATDREVRKRPNRLNFAAAEQQGIGGCEVLAIPDVQVGQSSRGHQRNTSGNQVARLGKANSSISSTSCSATKGTTPRYMAAVGMSFGVTPRK